MADGMRRRGRAFELGQRNPATLPGSHPDAETFEQNTARTRYWRQLRKFIQSVNSAGMKY